MPITVQIISETTEMSLKGRKVLCYAMLHKRPLDPPGHHSPMTASSQGSAPASSFSSILASSNGTLQSLGTLQMYRQDVSRQHIHQSFTVATLGCLASL